MSSHRRLRLNDRLHKLRSCEIWHFQSYAINHGCFFTLSTGDELLRDLMIDPGSSVDHCFESNRSH
jgi:hypothetical protein